MVIVQVTITDPETGEVRSTKVWASDTSDSWYLEKFFDQVAATTIKEIVPNYEG